MREIVRSTQELLSDRIGLMAVLLVACFVSVVLLSSQSRASYPTYALALFMIATTAQWRDVLDLPLMRWILALLIWLSISTFWSDPFELRTAVSVWVRALLVFCFVVAFAECQLRGQLQHWMGIALTVFGAIAVIAAITYFHLENPADGRLKGLGQLDTHVIAALVYGGIGLFALRFFNTYPRISSRILAVFVLVAIGYAVFESDSRNAWVSVLLGVGVFMLANRVAEARQFLVSVVTMGVIFAVLLGLLLLGDGSQEILLPRGDSYRLLIWENTLSQFTQGSYFIGRGILTSDDVEIGGMLFEHPHNMYIAIFHQGGAVGVLIYLVVIFKSFSILLEHYHHKDAKLALGLLTIAVSAYLLDGHELIDKVGDTWLLFWLPVAVAVGLQWRPTKLREL